MSDFLHVLTLPIRKLYVTVASIWILGLAAGTVFQFVQYRKLERIFRENHSVEDIRCE